MKMRRPPLRCAILCAITLFTSSLAPNMSAAQTKPVDRARARELYAQGQHFFKEGSYESALAAFEEAHRVLPNPVVLLSVAECQVRTERYEAALGTLQQYLAVRPGAPDAAQVHQQIEALRLKPARIEVTSTPDGAELTVDGARTGQSTPTTLEVSAGRHAIVASAAGYRSAEKVVAPGIGARESVQLVLEPIPQPVAAAPVEQAPVTEETAARRRHAGPAVWTSVGIAAAGFVTGGVLGGLALKTSSDFDDKPSAATADKGERLALFADVGFGIGAAASITALVLYLTSTEPAPSSDAPAVSIVPVGGPHRAGVVGSLKF